MRGPSPSSEAAAADPALEEQQLARFVERTTVALAACLGPDGELLDPASGSATPPDHYAETFTALALALRDAADERWRLLFARWRRHPARARGHAPFNRLALLLLRDSLQRRGQLGIEEAGWITEGLAACPLRARYPSNNWVLLAAACRLLEAATPARRRAADKRLARLLARWTTPAGGFVDYPAQPDAAEVTTPITYHAKALLVLLLVKLGAPESEAPRRLARGTAWLLAFTDERGRAGGFGRSNHALFGYACMLAVYAHGMRAAAGERERRAFAVGVRRLRLLLEDRRREDGLLSITLNPLTGAAGGWDDYMHLSVYNAWTAGLLAWLLAREAPVREAASASVGVPASAPASAAEPAEAGFDAPDLSGLGAEPQVLAQDERAGLLALRGRRGMALLSTRGQPVQGLGERHADLRTAAALPFHLVLDGRARLAPPVRVRLEALAAHPALAGFTPVLRAGDTLYGLHRLDELRLLADGPRLLVVVRGLPVALAAPRPARGQPGWLADTVDHYVLSDRRRRARALRPPALEGHVAAVAIAVDLAAGWIAHLVRLSARSTTAVLQNPHGRALLPSGEALTLRRATWVGGASVATEAGDADTAELPSALGGGRGACAAPQAWPAAGGAWLTVLGPPGAPTDDPQPLRYDAGAARLSVPWGELSLT
jgi:hypothetical protein